MGNNNNSRSWTDPITGEIYPGENPHVSIQKSSVPRPLNSGSAYPQPQSSRYERDVQPVPQPQPTSQTPPIPSGVTKFCEHCGSIIDKAAVICPSCGCQVAAFQQAQPAPLRQTMDAPTMGGMFMPQVFINNITNNSPQNTASQANGKRIDKWTAFFLCFFLGSLGAHKFYEGKVGLGVLYVFTIGLFGIGWIVDLIRIACKPNPYYV